MLSVSQPVEGETSTREETSGGYTIEGIPNEHQLDPTVGYYYLKEGPGSEDSVKIKLVNSSSKEKTLEVRVTDANTNLNGIIDYTGQLKNDEHLKIPLTSLMEPKEQEVKVPANSSEEASLTIHMPKEAYPGVIVGGVVVSEKQEENKQKETLAVGSTYSYTLGVVLTNEDKIDLKKNVSVELKKVGPILFDGRKIVQADILNPNPYIFSDAKVSGKIIQKESKKIVREQIKENVSIAPYSVFPFQFDWNKEELTPGKYLFKGTVEADGKIWKLEKEFGITEDTAKKINSESVFKLQIPNWLNIGTLLLVVLSLCNILFLLLRYYRRKD
jgi:hypothetical protein